MQATDLRRAHVKANAADCSLRENPVPEAFTMTPMKMSTAISAPTSHGSAVVMGTRKKTLTLAGAHSLAITTLSIWAFRESYLASLY